MGVFDVTGKIFYSKKINNEPNYDTATPDERIAWYVKNGKAKDLVIDNDQKDLNEYIYKIKARKGVIKNYVHILGFVNDLATHLIKFLKKEYHLK